MPLSELAVNAGADAVCRLLDGGRLELCGPANEPLVVLPFGTPAFAPARGGVADAHPLAPAWATRAGTVTRFRAVTAVGLVVWEGSAGTQPGADMVLTHATVGPHAAVSVTRLSYAER